jgi:hypothetical protein
MPYSSSFGKLYPYDKSYDRITTKAEKPLQILDRLRYNTTTSDDIVLQQVCLVQYDFGCALIPIPLARK